MKGTIRICSICQERKGLKFFGVCAHQDVHDREESNRVQFATWKEASRRDITGGVAGACSPEGGGVAGEAAAPAAEDGAALDCCICSSSRILCCWPARQACPSRPFTPNRPRRPCRRVTTRASSRSAIKGTPRRSPAATAALDPPHCLPAAIKRPLPRLRAPQPPPPRAAPPPKLQRRRREPTPPPRLPPVDRPPYSRTNQGE